MRFKFDIEKSRILKNDPRRKISFVEVQKIWNHYRAIGWVKGKLYTVIFEVGEDSEGEYYHLVTLWKSTKQEEKLYEKHT